MKNNQLIEATITNATFVADEIRKLTLRFNYSKYQFSPGQWIDLHINQPGKNIGGYTITSIPDDNNSIELIVRKSTHHPVTMFLHQDSVIGQKVKITEGQGKFTLKSSSLITPPIFVAGGIGLTPLISMAKFLDSKNLPYDLLYSIKSPPNNILANENVKHYKIFITGKERTESDFINRRITIEDLLLNNQKNRDIYLCGPKAMIDDLTKNLKTINYNSELIHFEKWW